SAGEGPSHPLSFWFIPWTWIIPAGSSLIEPFPKPTTSTSTRRTAAAQAPGTGQMISRVH
ncbi:hypothetical protein E4U54_002850, partial [Claviceps lovelessii]